MKCKRVIFLIRTIIFLNKLDQFRYKKNHCKYFECTSVSQGVRQARVLIFQGLHLWSAHHSIVLLAGNSLKKVFNYRGTVWFREHRVRWSFPYLKIVGYHLVDFEICQLDHFDQCPNFLTQINRNTPLKSPVFNLFKNSTKWKGEKVLY